MKKVLKAYWSVLTPRWVLILMIVLNTCFVAMTTVIPYALRAIVHSMEQGNAAGSIWFWFWVFLGLICARLFFRRTFNYLEVWFLSRVVRNVDELMFDKILGQSLPYFENNFTGSIIKQASRFRFAVRMGTDILFYQVLRTILFILISIGIFTYESPTIGLIFTIWVVIFVIITTLFSRWKYQYDAIEVKNDSILSGHIADTISQISTTKSYAQESSEIGEFLRKADNSLAARSKAWTLQAHFHLLQAVLFITIQVVIIGVLIGQWEAGIMTIADFVFFQTALFTMANFIWDIGGAIHKLFVYTADASEMADVIYQTPDIIDVPNATALKVDDGDIKFANMGFAYPNNTQHRIEDFSLHVKPNESLALVGPTGAGKTTLIKLLLRFIEPNKGSILIDSQDITKATKHSLRSSIALVSQQPELFHRSLLDNIRYARPEATEQEVIAASKKAHAHEFITKTADGYQTLVGERGVKLSGGERQRIALSRAFLADRPILILDEATSALDSATEKLIQESISELLKGRTSIVIAHRLSTIMAMDRIIVLDNGSIVESGTHEQLLVQKGLYSNLWSHQSGGYLSD